jgi:hypothetical protein
MVDTNGMSIWFWFWMHEKYCPLGAGFWLARLGSKHKNIDETNKYACIKKQFT